jgi:ubiquinone/menaquinone biosynthesis C-methylase UbiE
MMLHHLPDDLKARGFTEVKRVLKPGGRLLAVDLSGKGMIGRLLSLVGHKFPATYADDLVAMMSEAGLSAQLIDSEDKQHVTILARKPAT